MRWGYVVVGAAIVSAIGSPALASGHHISCKLNGVVEQKNVQQKITRTLNFYLDDTGEKLVSDKGGDFSLSVRTTFYSDTAIKAEISDGGFMPENVFLFGSVLKPPALFSLDRTNGGALIVAGLAPAGADVEFGNCLEIVTPPTKF